MSTHDPRRFAEDLRDHLAAPDRHLAFLFGAGTSSSIRVPQDDGSDQALIPDVDALTTLCEGEVRALGDPFGPAWDALAAQCAHEDRPANVEDILSNVRTKIEAVGHDESLAGLGEEGLSAMEESICTTIARVATPNEEAIPANCPHDAFADWVKRMTRNAPLEVFTTNYDILFERALELARVPVFDAFVGAFKPFFFPESLDDESMLPHHSWVRLWKLHGSVNWSRVPRDRGFDIVRGQPSQTGGIILPSHRKYDESRKEPYLSFMDRLTKVLSQPHSLLIICGFSFSDDHVNAILYGILDSRPTANVIALQYEDLQEDDPLVLQGCRRRNLTVAGPNGAVIDGVWGNWKLTEAVDERTHSFMDLAFDSNAAPDLNGEDAGVNLTGRMRLGDFNWLCSFLQDMAGSEE